MPFPLARSANNIITEVQRWQYFLRVKRGITIVGTIDGGFGSLTEQATKVFQAQNGLAETGKVDAATLAAAEPFGYTIQPNNFYAKMKEKGFPSGAGRSRIAHQPGAQRGADLLQVQAVGEAAPSRSRRHRDHVELQRRDRRLGDQLHHTGRGAAARPSAYLQQRLHARPYARRASPDRVVRSLGSGDLMHLFLTYEGAFVARYIRDGSPSAGAHGIKQSKDVGDLSNHAFGSAFDVNATWNMRGKSSARRARKAASSSSSRSPTASAGSGAATSRPRTACISSSPTSRPLSREASPRDRQLVPYAPSSR